VSGLSQELRRHGVVEADEPAFLRNVASYFLQLLVPLALERLLVDLELADIGPGSSVCTNFWAATNGEWVPGDLSFDRGVLALLRDLPWLRAAWHCTVGAGDRGEVDRALLTAVTVQQMTDVRVWSHLVTAHPPSIFLDSARLRAVLAQRAAAANNSVRLPQTLDALCLQLGVEVPERAVFFPSTSTTCVSQPAQLTRSIKMLFPDSEARQAECLKQVELRYEEAQYYRDRFDDRAQKGLIADGQILDSLAKLEPEKARATLGQKSPKAFVKEFAAPIKGVGPFVALKVASVLQLIGHLQEDDIPALDPTLGAFCALRAAIGDVLHGVEIGDTWPLPATLSPQGHGHFPLPCPLKGAGGADCPRHAGQVELVGQGGVWAERVKRGDGVGRHEAAIAMAFIPRRTALQVENMLCKVGCRQRRAMAKVRILAAGVRRSWKKWRFKGPIKTLDKVTLLSQSYAGVKRIVERRADVCLVGPRALAEAFSGASVVVD